MLPDQEVSYGLHIYNMPMLNCIVHTGHVGSRVCVVIRLFASTVCAILSWVAVERPFLRRKKVGLSDCGIELLSPNPLAVGAQDRDRWPPCSEFEQGPRTA